MPTPCRQPVAIDEPDAVGEAALPRRQLDAVRVAVEDGEEADEDRGDRDLRPGLRRDHRARAAGPRGRCRSPTPGRRHADETEKGAQRHDHREGDGQQPDRRRAELRPPESHRDHRQHVVEPGDRVPEAGEEPGRRAGLLVRQRGAGDEEERAGQESDRGGARTRLPSLLHRAPSEQHPGALNRPERAERADRVAGQGLCPARPADLEHAERAFEAENQGDEEELAGLDADVEEQQGEGDLGLRQAHAGEAAGETETVQQAEGEGDHPGMPDGEARLAAPPAHDLGTEKEDRERDRGIERRSGRRGVAERRDGQGDRVRQSEGADRLQEHPAVGDDQQQAEHEQQMVHAEQDVLDAEPQVAHRPLPAGGLAAEHDRGRDRPQHVALEPPVGVVDAHQNVGDGRFEPADAQSLAGQATRALEGAAHDLGAGRELLPVGRRESAALWHHRRDPDLDLAARRPLPQQAVGLRTGFGDLEQARPGLVRRERARRADERQNQHQNPGAERGRREHRNRFTVAPPSPVPPPVSAR